MVSIQLSEQEIEIMRSALRYIFDEIEDDLAFERLIGSTRWAAEDLLQKLPREGRRK